MTLHDSVAIVTGAAQGIGYAISGFLLREGYKVCLADINTEKGNESLNELQKKYSADRIIFVQCDVASKTDLEEVFQRTQKQFGRIDLVVNNAGIVDEHNPERMVAINLLGTIYGCDLALKFMGTKNGGQGGAVINTSSTLGIIPYPNLPVYTATKHGVVGLTRSYGFSVTHCKRRSFVLSGRCSRCADCGKTLVKHYANIYRFPIKFTYRQQDKAHFDQNRVIFMAICPCIVNTPLIFSAKPLFPFTKEMTAMAIAPESVAEGVLLLLKDRRNGSTLMTLPEGHQYVERDERLKKIVQVSSNR